MSPFFSSGPPTDNGERPAWQVLGFAFHPFEQDEASQDAHLAAYFVEREETFASAWASHPTLIFAPPGGGKTAMRLFTMLSCWVGVGGYHPFPISYNPAAYLPVCRDPSLDNHLRGIIRASAIALLMGLVFRPERFLALSRTDRQTIVAILGHRLPSPLARYLSLLESEADPRALVRRLDQTYLLPNPPDQALLGEFCRAMRQLPVTTPSWLDSPTECWHLLSELLTDALEMRHLLILIDGVDGIPETINDPGRIVHWLTPLLRQSPTWAEQKIFFKGFLPEQTEAPLRQALPDLWPSLHATYHRWQREQLAALLRQRIYIATNGTLSSFDAVSSPDLRQVEEQLVDTVIPLPREAIAIARRLLQQFGERASHGASQLEKEDLDAAVAWYQEQQAWLRPYLAPDPLFPP